MMMQNIKFSPSLHNICGDLYNRLEDKNSRNDCVREILESHFEGKISEQDYVFYQFLKVLTEMYKEGFNAGKKICEPAAPEEKNIPTADITFRLKRPARKSASDDFAMQLAPVINDIRDKGARTLQEIADKLTELGIKTVSGYDQWHPATVRHLEKRIARQLFA